MPTGLMAALVTRLAEHLLMSGRSSLPFSNFAPARTRATRWGALTARQWAWADSMSLKAIATPAAREPGPLVTRVGSLTVAKVYSIALAVRRWIQCSAG
jgi:hypothetical protein